MKREPKRKPERRREKRRARAPARRPKATPATRPARRQGRRAPPRMPTKLSEKKPAVRSAGKPELKPTRAPARGPSRMLAKKQVGKPKRTPARMRTTTPEMMPARGPDRRPERTSAIDREKEYLRSRLQSIDGRLSSTSSMISSVESELNYVDGAMASLPTRLSKIRSQGYECMSYLEKSQELLATRWAESSPLIRQGFLDSIQPLRGEVSRLRSEIDRLRIEMEYGNLDLVRSSASGWSSEVSSLNLRTASETRKLSNSVKEFKSGISALDRDLRIAETTMAWVSQASFPWKVDESPVLALKGKMMTGDKKEGTIFLTNQRFIFEGTKEVVLKRVLFIATKKKTVRTVLIDQPIGIVQEISKGRVGFLAWAGVYIRFKPASGLEEIPFDVKSKEVDMMIKFFNHIISGEADLEIATVRGVEPKTARPAPKIIRCPNCSAPYTREVYRGQTTIQCEYCQSAIRVTD